MTQRPPLFTAFLLPLVTVAAALGLAACGEPQANQAPPAELRPVRAQKVAYEDAAQRFSLAGTLEARIESPIAFRTAGKITERLVNVGDEVRPGAVLARLDDEDHRLQVRTTRAQVESARADLAKAKADLDRYERLRESQVFTQATFDQRRSAADMARARYEQMSGQLRMMENQLAYTTLAADVRGVVTQVKAEAGQVVQSGQAIVHIARTDEVEAVVAVPEHRLAELKSASRLAVTLWAEGGETDHPVRLRELAPGADPTTRTYVARFSLLEPPAGIRLGMSATLTVERAAAERLAALPLTALFQQGAEPAVWVVDPKTGRLTLTAVTVARYRQDAVLIADGVPEGALIVTAGVHKLDAGQRVRLLGQAKG
jgi:membrane fusion protein, multidrug efflux system